MQTKIRDYKKEFINGIKELTYSRNIWEVWTDLITVMACSISNAVDKKNSCFESREREYKSCITRLGGVEKPARLFTIIVETLEHNPNQDFLGNLYMELGLGSHWKGQFFTPYTVSSMMAKLTIGDCKKTVEEKGWISICDPCIGGGAMLIAAANEYKRQGINYQRHVLFVGQDIDRVVAMMAYIQLSLLGCPGYICVADSLNNPIVGSTLFPQEQEKQEFWYTPFYFRNVWMGRRIKEVLGLNNLVRDKEPQHITVENEVGKGYFFFFGNEQEDCYMNENNKNLAEELEENIAEETTEAVAEENVGEIDNVEVDTEETAEKKPSYATGEEKLKAEEEEILVSVDEQYKDVAKAQFGMVFDELIKKTNEDEDFNSKVLLEHKSFARCMKYCGNKAMGLRNPSDQEKEAARNGSPIVTPVSSDLLFTWIYEYYDLDDKAEVEKENAKPKATKSNWPAKDTKKKEKPTPKPKKDESTQKEKPKPVKGKKDMEGQFSLFDMF